MRYTLFAVIIILCSCSARYYTYKVAMTHPVTSPGLRYENDSFSVDFNLSDRAIETFIYNKMNEGIRINWDEVSFSINGKTYRVTHAQKSLRSITELQPPTTIPPKSNIQDYLVPSDKIYFNRTPGGQGYLYIANMFPTYDYGRKKTKNIIRNWKGVRITLYMPFYIHNQFFSYYYDMIVTDVIESKKRPADFFNK